MSKLNTAIKALAGVLGDACPRLKSVTRAGDQVVVVADDRKVVINLLFLDPDEYPRSGVLVQVDEEASKCSSKVVGKLGALSERFQDGAQLCAVISKVCAVLDIPVEEDVLRAAEKQAAGGGAAGAPGSDTAMDEDASVDPMSEDYPASGSDGSSSDDDDGGYDGLMDDKEEKELMVECGQRQGRWNRYEQELAAASEQQVLSMEQGKASKQQIFSSEEAFKMLSNELLGFIRRQFTGEETNVSADSAGDDLYTWNVELWRTAFKPDCQLAKDLAEVSSKFAVSSVQLRFTFMRGLHPFYPPRVEVVRPHLSTPLPGALSSHPLLRLENWHPTLTMTQVVDNIRAFLEEYGHIDVSDPRNSSAAHPSSAFSPVQVALARLEAMTDVKPACYSQYRALYEGRSTQSRLLQEAAAEVMSPTQSQQAKKARTEQQETAPAATPAAAAAGGAAAAAGAAAVAFAAATAAGTVWAKGTGYGHGYSAGYRAGASSAPVWDAKAAEAAQAAQDEQLNGVLQSLATALQEEFPSSSSSSGGGGGDGVAAGPSSSSGAGSKQQQQQQQEGSSAQPLSVSQEKCLEALHASVLRPLLARELSQVAFPEMVQRHQYFKPLLSVVEALCQPATESFLAGNAAAGEQESAAAAGSSSKAGKQQQQVGRAVSIAGAVRGIQKGASIVKKQLTKALEAAPTGNSSRVDKQAEAVKQQTQLSIEVADMVLSIVDKLSHITPAEDAAAAAAAAAAAQATAAAAPAAAAPGRRTTRAAAAAAAAAGPPAATAAAGASDVNHAEAYKAALKPFVLDTANISAFHKMKADAASDPAGLKARVQKVTSEIAGIERLIEVNETSSIFIRVDEDNTFLWRALITGPEDTPYSGGCFLFDMFFPANYPSVPPKVLITTTGGSTVRFNPNLYNCGKVCLSLLGTWSGGQGESWDAQASSAFQVLVSIQSLILVPQPYFNEPGYEARGNMAESKRYNEVIREATIRWAMLDQLSKPPAEFAPVIQAHFKHRGPYILNQIDGWIGEATDSGHKGRLQALKGQLEAELAKLQ